MSSALSVSGLVVSPPGLPPVLRGVDFELAAGARAALVGPSGAGKTTLLRAIAGLERPSSGKVRLGGASQLRIPANRRPIAMVFQEPRLLPHLSVADNVALPLRAAGIGSGARRATAVERLGEVGLAGFAERRVAGLSGGEQQRVALARALCADPELLLLDEPLGALDPNRRESLRALIVEAQRRRGLTTLLVTHDRSEAAELGESIALMLEGRIVQHAEPRAMFERPVSGAAARFMGISNLLRRPGGGLRTIWAIRPERVGVGAGPYEAMVLEAVYQGTQVRLALDWDGQRVEALVPPGCVPAPGSRVAFDLPGEHLWELSDDGATLPASSPREDRVAGG